MALLLALPVEVAAQTQQDFVKAMQSPKASNGAYCLTLPKKWDSLKLVKNAGKWGYRLVTVDDANGKAYFLPAQEYADFLKAGDVLAAFNQFPARARDMQIKKSNVNERIVRLFKERCAIDPNSERVNKNLKGTDFKSTGAVWFYNHQTDGLDLMQDAKWTGEVVNGMVDGRGDGCVVVKDQNGENVYRSFSGSFKNGFPCGDVTYAILLPKWDIVNAIYASPIKESTTFGEVHEGLASFKWINGYGFMDTQGHVVVSPQFSQIKQDFANGKATVTSNGLDIVINKKGEFLSIAEGVKEIPAHSFDFHSYLKNVKEVVIPSSVTKIGNKAFQSNQNLERVVIPNSVTEIGDEAFSGCKRLTSITLPGSIKQIGNNAFMNCEHLASATVSESLIDLVKGKKIFNGCSPLNEVTVNTASGNVVHDHNWYWKQAKDPDEDIRRYELAAKASGEGLTVDDFFALITKNNMQDIRAYLEARNFQPGDSKKSDWYQSIGDITDWDFGYKLEWEPSTDKWLRRSASDFLLLTVSYDNGKKRVQAINCHFPYTVLKDAFMKMIPQKQYSIDKVLTFLSRTTFMNKDKDKITIYNEDDGTYIVEFEKDFNSIYQTFEESMKRDQEYIKSLGK